MSANLVQPIVHIGLGKTATTSLQRNVFPNIPSIRNEVIYNDKALISQLIGRNTMTTIEEKKFQTAFRLGQNIISDESLVDWNPRNWQMAAEKNLKLFGRETTIIITVRPTESYLCSVYQQMVHQGNVWSPDEFFVSSAEFDRLAPLMPRMSLTKFDVDSFNLELLYRLYSEKFSKVVIVPLSAVSELQFLKKTLHLNHEELNYLKQKVKNGRVHNRAYSSSAMAMTMKREKLLNIIGLMSYGSSAREIILREDTGSRSAFRDLNFVEKLLGFPRRLTMRIFPRRLTMRIANELNWRYFIQNRFDRIFPYNKYSLPPSVYRNDELARKNDSFIKSFE